MTTETSFDKVLFVDDEEMMRDMLARQARSHDIEDFEVYEDADSAVARLRELGEITAAIFSDGLNGGWREVIAAAKEARVPVAVLSGDTYIREEVEETGAIFLSKAEMKPGFVADTLKQLSHLTES